MERSSFVHSANSSSRTWQFGQRQRMLSGISGHCGDDQDSGAPASYMGSSPQQMKTRATNTQLPCRPIFMAPTHKAERRSTLTVAFRSSSPGRILQNAHPTIARQELQKKTRTSCRGAFSTSVRTRSTRRQRPCLTTLRGVRPRIGTGPIENILSTFPGTNLTSRVPHRPLVRDPISRSGSAPSRHPGAQKARERSGYPPLHSLLAKR
jgi:hypothetical protein